MWCIYHIINFINNTVITVSRSININASTIVMTVMSCGIITIGIYVQLIIVIILYIKQVRKNNYRNIKKLNLGAFYNPHHNYHLNRSLFLSSVSISSWKVKRRAANIREITIRSPMARRNNIKLSKLPKFCINQSYINIILAFFVSAEIPR